MRAAQAEAGESDRQQAGHRRTPAVDPPECRGRRSAASAAPRTRRRPCGTWKRRRAPLRPPRPARFRVLRIASCRGSSLGDRLHVAGQLGQVAGDELQVGVAVRLGHAAHDRVVAADVRVLVGLVRLQRDVQVVGVLAGELGIASDRSAVEVGAVARGAVAPFRSSSATCGASAAAAAERPARLRSPRLPCRASRSTRRCRRCPGRSARRRWRAWSDACGRPCGTRSSAAAMYFAFWPAIFGTL